jgi:hypothetical protein
VAVADCFFCIDDTARMISTFSGVFSILAKTGNDIGKTARFFLKRFLDLHIWENSWKTQSSLWL